MKCARRDLAHKDVWSVRGCYDGDSREFLDAVHLVEETGQNALVAACAIGAGTRYAQGIYLILGDMMPLVGNAGG